jgi:hypothetical protein
MCIDDPLCRRDLTVSAKSPYCANKLEAVSIETLIDDRDRRQGSTTGIDDTDPDRPERAWR